MTPTPNPRDDFTATDRLLLIVSVLGSSLVAIACIVGTAAKLGWL